MIFSSVSDFVKTPIDRKSPMIQSFSIFNLTDSFDMGFDIQQYYSMYQNLTLEDLAKASSRHTLKGVVKVINKVSLSPKGAFIYDVRFIGSSL